MPVNPAPWQATQAGSCFAPSPCRDDRLAARDECRIPLGRLFRRERRAQRRVVLRHFLEVRVGKVRNQVVHRRVAAGAVAERDQLVIEVARGLAGDAGEVAVVRALALLAVAGDAPLDARGHGGDVGEARAPRRRRRTPWRSRRGTRSRMRPGARTCAQEYPYCWRLPMRRWGSRAGTRPTSTYAGRRSPRDSCR